MPVDAITANMGCGCQNYKEPVCVHSKVISKIHADHDRGKKVNVPSLGSVGQALKICLLMAVDRLGGAKGLSKS